MKLSGWDSNSSCPRMLLPAALFPAPERPSKIRRSSGGVDNCDGDEGGDEEDRGTGVGEAPNVCVVYEEGEKVGE